jgi:hypothetical protein
MEPQWQFMSKRMLALKTGRQPWRLITATTFASKLSIAAVFDAIEIPGFVP